MSIPRRASHHNSKKATRRPATRGRSSKRDSTPRSHRRRPPPSRRRRRRARPREPARAARRAVRWWARSSAATRARVLRQVRPSPAARAAGRMRRPRSRDSSRRRPQASNSKRRSPRRALRASRAAGIRSSEPSPRRIRSRSAAKQGSAQSGHGARVMSRFLTLTNADRCGARPWHGLLAGFVAFALTLNVAAQAPAAPSGAASPPAEDELVQLVGPIALYPDDLVAIILPAATNPLQLVQADRFLDKRKADPKLAVDEKWDDSVKSLLNYPDVVKMMSADLDWTSALGEAVVTDQGAVLDAIQIFRRKAQAAGNLKSDAKQVVTVEKEIITVVPADPQVIYVPQYNPATVVTYGAPYWGYYPTPYPSYYYPYPPGAALATGVIWGAAIGAAWAGGHYVSHYGGDANININRNTNINTGNINRGGASQLPAGGSTAR